MSFENFPSLRNETPPDSLEVLKEVYKQRLDTILNKQLTVENIEVFADESLAEMIQLTDDILVQYRNKSEFQGDTTLNTRQQEDEAFSLLGLPNIQEVLQSIIDVKEKIEALKIYISTNTECLDEVITPPQPDLQIEINGGSGKTIEEKKMFPRLLTLLYILEHDFDIDPNEVSITEGIVTPKMMRQTPYVRVEISELERVMYICDEEGNASYIFDTLKLEEQSLTLEEIDLEDKGDKNFLIMHYPGMGIRLIQSDSWRGRVSEALGEPIPEKQIVTDKPEERKNISEFSRERVSFLSFEDFQNEVRALFPEEGGIRKWYSLEKKNHENWPSNPDKAYKNQGWLGYSELVGRIHSFLSFENLQNEVSDLCPKEGNIVKWYNQEKKNHENWPSNPRDTYKNQGWLGYSELVGRGS